MSNEKQEKSTEQTTTEPRIILTIKDEHKYTLMLLSVLREQLAEFDIGKSPDYQLMLDIMNYMANFPDKFNHPAKTSLIESIIKKSDGEGTELEDLLAEKRQINDLAHEVIQALKSLLKESTMLKEEQLKIFSKNYVELIEAHIEIESRLLFRQARQYLSADELQEFTDKQYFEEDHPLANLVEERYKELSKLLNKRLDDWEGAANELALAEFVGMGAFFESIEPLSIGLGEVSQIIKQHSYNMYQQYFQCYKDLLTQKQETPSDYIKQPIDCMMSCYKEYVAGIGEIGQVLKKTTKQIKEPYEARKPFYKDSKSAIKKKVKGG